MALEPVDIVGIDLGTTNSAVAIWLPDEERVSMLRGRDGAALVPSAVYYQPHARPVVGARALGHRVDEPEAVAYSVKRFMGRTAEDRGVASDRDQVIFTVQEEAAHHGLRLDVGSHVLTPTEVSADVLRALRDDAATALGRPVERAVITVPAYFEEPQREATREAGRRAGLDVRRLISEPTAAALAFGLGAEPQTVLVYDLGGGTFDVSIVSVIKGGLFRVRGTDGNTHLGGDDFDRAIVRWLAEGFRESHGIDVPDDVHVRARLLEAAEQAKIALTTDPSHTVSLSGLVGERALVATIDRSRLAQLTRPLIDETVEICDRLIGTLERDWAFPADQIDQVLLVGGQTRSPVVKDVLRARLRPPINDGVDPDYAVAQGAALLGARLCGHLADRMRLMDVLPLSLGVELRGGRFERVVGANAPIPVEIWRRGASGFTTGEDGQDQIRFRIFQGERPLARDNAAVGEVVLGLGAPRPAGAPRIACLFRVDQDGILHVRAEDESADAGGVEVSFDRSYQLSQARIEEERQGAEDHAAEDATTARLLALAEQLDRLGAGGDPDPDAVARARRAIDARDLDRAEEFVSAALARPSQPSGSAP